jgi:methyl acetate hydrolase
MNNELTTVCDAVLNRVVTSNPRVPGVVAMATDRRANTYEGAAGKRQGVSTARACQSVG